MPAEDWVPLGGSTRRYRNVRTGEEISRRRYDKLYGTLAREGYSSYERKAKARRERLPSGRWFRPPARNRPGIYLADTLDAFVRAWRTRLRAKHGDARMVVVFADTVSNVDKIAADRLIDIVVAIPTGFSAATVNMQPLIRNVSEFLTKWGNAYRSQTGFDSRILIFALFTISPVGQPQQQIIRSPLRSNSLTALTGDTSRLSLLTSLALYFRKMESVTPRLDALMYPIFIPRS